MGWQLPFLSFLALCQTASLHPACTRREPFDPCASAQPCTYHQRFFPLRLRGGSNGGIPHENSEKSRRQGGRGHRYVDGSMVSPAHRVWVQHDSWQDEWERTTGHDIRRLRALGVTDFTQEHKRPSPAPEDGETIVGKGGNSSCPPLDAIHQAPASACLFIQSGTDTLSD